MCFVHLKYLLNFFLIDFETTYCVNCNISIPYVCSYFKNLTFFYYSLFIVWTINLFTLFFVMYLLTFFCSVSFLLVVFQTLRHTYLFYVYYFKTKTLSFESQDYIINKPNKLTSRFCCLMVIENGLSTVYVWCT